MLISWVWKTIDLELAILLMIALNSQEKARRIIVVLSCGLLVVVSLITFQEQIPTISKTTKIYDKEYISALRNVGNRMPPNETLTTTENYPQVLYFTDHKVRVPWEAETEKSLVQFMWKINSSYLLVPEDNYAPELDKTPILIQLVEKPFEKVFDLYYDYISVPKRGNNMLKIHQIIKEKSFERLFEKISDYTTEYSVLHLYHLRSNIILDILNIVTDNKKPNLFVMFPINGTVIESKSDVLPLNIKGSSWDTGGKMKKVEVSVNDLVFERAKPEAPDDWSAWSSSHYFTSKGTKKIIVKASDIADNETWLHLYITIKKTVN
jgi:hypothetical protein